MVACRGNGYFGMSDWIGKIKVVTINNISKWGSGYYLKLTRGHWGLFIRINIEQRKPTKHRQAGLI